MTTTTTQMISDKGLADLLDVSLAWVKQQQHKRKNNQEHALTVDPIYLGKTKRYRLADIEQWIQSCSGDTK